MIHHFSIIKDHFIFLLIEFRCTFSIYCKIIPYYVYIVIWLGSERPSGFSFVPTLLLSILKLLFLPSSSVSLYYFILAVLMRECFGKHPHTSSPISYSHTEWYFLFSLFGARETKHAQRTLLQALFLKWPFKTFN